MVLSKKALEEELVASRAALKSHKVGVEIHKIVSEAFEKKLEELYPKEK